MCNRRHAEKHDAPAAQALATSHASWLEPVREVILSAILKTSPGLNVRMRTLCGPLDGPLTVLARVTSLTVTAEFITLLVPILAVTVDVRFARQFMILFSLVLFSCNLVKNVLRLPRPHRVDDPARLLSDGERSFGFPSLHSASSVALPLLVVSTTESPLAAVLPSSAPMLALAWAGAIGWARLHLGVHSLPDVLGGWALGFGLWRLFTALQASGALDEAMYSTPWLAPCALPLALGLALRFPQGRGLDGKPGVTDDTVTEAVIVIGCTTGTLLTAWREAQLPALAAPPLLGSLAPRDGALGALVLRVAVAAVGTLATKTVCKQATRRAVDAAADLVGWPPPPRFCDGTTARERCARLGCYVLLACVVLDVQPALME